MGHYIPKIVYGDSLTTIQFDYPPARDDGEELETKDRTSVAISGARQVSADFMEARRSLQFRFVSQAIKAQFDTFIRTHAALGKPFRYYEDSSSPDYVTYEHANFKYQPAKITGVGANAYIWEFELPLRRVVDLVPEEITSEDTQMVSILNNQAVDVDLYGAAFDSDIYSQAILVGELRRRTDSSERVARVTLVCTYRNDTSEWTIGASSVGDDVGVDFSIDPTTGQITYLSDNQSGSNYSGTFKYQQVTVAA